MGERWKSNVFIDKSEDINIFYKYNKYSIIQLDGKNNLVCINIKIVSTYDGVGLVVSNCEIKMVFCSNPVTVVVCTISTTFIVDS
jgi:hypothetical protein